MPEQVGGKHYHKAGSKCPSCQCAIQHWDYAAGLPYLDAQISKYIDRHQDKGGFQDMLKSLTYWEKAVKHYYPEEYKWWLEEKQLASVTQPVHFEHPSPMWPPHAFEPGPVICRKCNLDFDAGSHVTFATVRATYPDGRPLDDGASDGNSIYDPPGETQFFQAVDYIPRTDCMALGKSHRYVKDVCEECGDRVRPFQEQMDYLRSFEKPPEVDWPAHAFEYADVETDKCVTCCLSLEAGNHIVYTHDPISCPVHNYVNNTCQRCGNKCKPNKPKFKR